MKATFIVLLAVLLCLSSVAADKKKPLTKEESAKVIEAHIRKVLRKPTGELTKVDLERVTRLNLTGKQLTSMKGLENLTKLTWLLLGGNHLTDLKGLEKLSQLKSLNLYDNKLTSVKGLEKLTKLTLLSLNGNNLTDVKALENLKSLKVLYLLDNKLTDVKGLEKLTQLKQLFLNNNPDLTKAQIDELQKALPKCTIEHNTKLNTPKFAKVVEDAIGMRLNKPYILKATGESTRGEITEADLEKVKMLNLGGNQLTSVKGLEKLTELRWLNLLNNPDLTKAQIDELKKALPKCRIISNPKK